MTGKIVRSLVNLVLCHAMASGQATAAEGGYSNYIPGFYGDLALAVEPADGLSLRNDVYFYSAEADESVRSGLIEAGIDIDLTFDYLTLLYKPGNEVFGARYAFGAAFARVTFLSDPFRVLLATIKPRSATSP